MDLVKTTTASQLGDDPLVYVMSDETVDRVGDVIRASGWDLTDFHKNPVALFAHDARFVIGSWTDVKVRGRQLIGRLKLLPKGVSERLDEIRAAVEAGVLRAVSVGFAPDPDEMERNKTGGWLIKRATLLECSLVGVPANPNALQVAKALKLSERAKALIFDKGATSDRVVRLDNAKRASPIVKLSGSRWDGNTRIVSVGKPFKITKINTPKPWKPGDPIRVIRTEPRVVKLSPEGRARLKLDEPKAPARVVKVSKEAIERVQRRASTVVVKLGKR